jgi:hypothetical protein
MSKWFGITIVVLLVFWLSLLSLAQLKLSSASHIYGVIIMQHEDDLSGIKLRMGRSMVQGKPTPQSASLAPPLPRQRRRPAGVASKFKSSGIELTPVHSCW